MKIPVKIWEFFPEVLVAALLHGWCMVVFECSCWYVQVSFASRCARSIHGSEKIKMEKCILLQKFMLIFYFSFQRCQDVFDH